MSRRDGCMLVGLALLAGFIWVRDRSWTTSVLDTLPIILALPLFFCLGGPWAFQGQGRPMHSAGVACSVVLMLAGVLADLVFPLAIGWTLLLGCWLSARLVPDATGSVRRLLVLPLLAFPWIALDFHSIGWWFRLSGSWATAGAFSLMGLDVTREGTSLLVQGMAIGVEAPCSGLNVLQSMLIAGVALAYLYLEDGHRYWWNLPLLVPMAWLANTLRIMMLCTVGLSVSPAFAMGVFHHVGGLVVLCLVFGFCWLLFTLQQAPPAGTA